MRRFALLVAGLALLAGVAATVSGGATQAETRWVITDLGAWNPVAINERGQVVGWGHDAHGDQHGYLWENGKMRALGLSAADDINERGQIAGSVAVKNGGHAALWEKGRIRDFGTLGGSKGDAIAVNDSGLLAGNDVVGEDADGYDIDHGFVWQRGKMTDLGTLGGTYTKVEAMNNRGQIVGVSNALLKDGVEAGRTFLWENGKMRDLGRFSSEGPINDRGQIPGRAYGRAAVWEQGTIRFLARSSLAKGVVAHDINELGAIAGACIVPPRPQNRLHPCLWSDGKVRDLGLVFGDRGYAVAVNDREQVIGNSRTGNLNFHAFVWENGKMTDLDTLGGKESEALAINNRGQIIGWSDIKAVNKRHEPMRHAVLWTLKRG